ncbi:MAG: bifunctional riboflavin kinase/FAD synthetase [Deltaproteobacteria bacterium]|nr:bifunctional riboflavin kinase/FAD synthetase [Deltaproteobacteria bacterium]
MELISADRDLSGLFHSPIMSLGNFDGVHLGHQLLIRRVCEDARKEGVSSVVYTFDPHPLSVLTPQRCPPLITSHGQKIELISALGVQFILVARFTPSYAAQSAREFVEKIIHRQIGPKKIIIGENFSFGRNRQGDPGLLAELGGTMGFEVEAVPRVRLEDTVVSSTLIRDFLIRGEVRAASRYLGRHHKIEGMVITGHNRGRAMGYPTANISLTGGICPAEGVYAVRVKIGKDLWPGVSSIGRNLTFGEEPLSIEVHIFGLEENLYGKEIKILFVERLRDQCRFAGMAELIAQISQDVARSKEILARAR